MSTGPAFPNRFSPFCLTLFLIPYCALAASLVQSSNQVVVSPHVIAFIGEEDKEQSCKRVNAIDIIILVFSALHG